MFPLFLYCASRQTLFIRKFFATHACFCFYVMGFRNQKNIFCTSGALLCFTEKNNFCIMNKIKLVWFYSLHRNYFSEKNCNLFIYFKICFTMLHLKIFLEYWIILYIFRKSLCVTSPFICKKLILNYKTCKLSLLLLILSYKKT